MKTEVCYLTNVRCLNQLLIEQNSSSNMLLLLRVSIAHLYAREETVTEFEKLEQLRCTCHDENCTGWISVVFGSAGLTRPLVLGNSSLHSPVGNSVTFYTLEFVTL